MDYFIADTHFGHEQVSRERGFGSVEEMDAELIARWQARVKPEDHVYIVGDFACRAARGVEHYLEQLPGQKHLAVGNHDRVWLRKVRWQRWFVEAAYLLEGTRAGKYFTCCHYPMLDWYRRRHGAYLIYGHVHTRTQERYCPVLETLERAYNAGADLTGLQPVTLPELVALHTKAHAAGEA